MNLATPYQTPPHHGRILEMESIILNGDEVPDHPPLRWNTAFLAQLGQVAGEVRTGRRASTDDLAHAAASAAAVALMSLRCVLRDTWEFPETDPATMPPRPRLPKVPDVGRPGALELVSTYENPAAPARPRHVDAALAGVSLIWACWVEMAEAVRDLHTGEMDASELWHAARDLQATDLAGMLDRLAEATAAAFDLVAEAHFGSLLTV